MISAGLFMFLLPSLSSSPQHRRPLIIYDNFFQLLYSFCFLFANWFRVAGFGFGFTRLVAANTYKDKYWQTMESLAFIITQMSSLLAFFKRGITSIPWMINDFLYLVNFLFSVSLYCPYQGLDIHRPDDGCSMKPLIIFML